MSTTSGTKGAHANFSLSCELDGGYTYADQSCADEINLNDGASYSVDQCPGCVPDILRGPPDASVRDRGGLRCYSMPIASAFEPRIEILSSGTAGLLGSRH